MLQYYNNYNTRPSGRLFDLFLKIKFTNKIVKTRPQGRMSSPALHRHDAKCTLPTSSHRTLPIFLSVTLPHSTPRRPAPFLEGGASTFQMRSIKCERRVGTLLRPRTRYRDARRITDPLKIIATATLVSFAGGSDEPRRRSRSARRHLRRWKTSRSDTILQIATATTFAKRKIKKN